MHFCVIFWRWNLMLSNVFTKNSNDKTNGLMISKNFLTTSNQITIYTKQIKQNVYIALERRFCRSSCLAAINQINHMYKTITQLLQTHITFSLNFVLTRFWIEKSTTELKIKKKNFILNE